MFLEPALQRAYLLHQTLLEFALVHVHSLHLLRMLMLLIDVCQSCGQETTAAPNSSTLFPSGGVRLFRPRRLAVSTRLVLSCLLLLKIVDRLVDKLVVAL